MLGILSKTRKQIITPSMRGRYGLSRDPIFLFEEWVFLCSVHSHPLRKLGGHMRISSGNKTGEGALKTAVRRIQRAYVVLGMLAIVSAIVTLFDEPGLRDILEAVIFLLVYGTVYLGLRRRKDWVIPLVLIFSAGSSLWQAVAILSPAEDVEAVLAKLFSGLLLMFFVYQFLFFSRQEVRLFFGSKGRILF